MNYSSVFTCTHTSSDDTVLSLFVYSFHSLARCRNTCAKVPVVVYIPLHRSINAQSIIYTHILCIYEKCIQQMRMMWGNNKWLDKTNILEKSRISVNWMYGRHFKIFLTPSKKSLLQDYGIWWNITSVYKFAFLCKRQFLSTAWYALIFIESEQNQCTYKFSQLIWYYYQRFV